MGLARFAFGMILPNMQIDLGISTTVSEFIGSANFAGYFIGIIFASNIYAHFKTAPLISNSLLILALSLSLMTLFDNYIIISIIYFSTGFLAAILNVAIVVYLSHALPEKIRGKGLGIAVSGNGIAIILSGYTIPYLEQFYQENSWRVSWLIFSFIIIVISFSIKYLVTI